MIVGRSTSMSAIAVEITIGIGALDIKPGEVRIARLSVIVINPIQSLRVFVFIEVFLFFKTTAENAKIHPSARLLEGLISDRMRLLIGILVLSLILLVVLII